MHAPYLVNVATTNNKIRIPSRKILDQHAEAAAALGARGLIVHGGHLNDGDDPQVGFDNWRKVFERATFDLPILIENTAGGDNAMARRLDRIARLWDAVGEFNPGFCLDTCHAHAGGEELLDLVDRVKAITGRIDLVHANGSRDAFGSGCRPARQPHRRSHRPGGDRRGLRCCRGADPGRDAGAARGAGRGHRVPAGAAAGVSR